MEFLVFLHNKLLNPLMLNKYIEGHGKIISYYPAATYGQVYKKKAGYYLYCNDAKIQSFTFGTLYQLKLDETGVKILDSYHGCSQYMYKYNLPTDLNHRVDRTVMVLKVGKAEDFIKQKFDVLDTINTQCYLYNTEHFKYYNMRDKHYAYNFISDFFTVHCK